MKTRIVYVKELITAHGIEQLYGILNKMEKDNPEWMIFPIDIVQRIDYVGDGWSITDLFKRILNLIIYKLWKWCKNE